MINEDLITKINYENVFNSKSTSLNVTPKRDGILDVTGYYSGWGYGGGAITMYISCSSLTPIVQTNGAIHPSDTVYAFSSCRSLFNVKKGITYNFFLNFVSPQGIGVNDKTYMIGILY